MRDDFAKDLNAFAEKHGCEIATDNYGQIIIYTGEMLEDDGIGYDPHTEAWAARAEEGRKRKEEYRKRHEERIAWIARVREEEAKKRQEGYPPF